MSQTCSRSHSHRLSLAASCSCQPMIAPSHSSSAHPQPYAACWIARDRAVRGKQLPHNPATVLAWRSGQPGDPHARLADLRRLSGEDRPPLLHPPTARCRAATAAACVSCTPLGCLAPVQLDSLTRSFVHRPAGSPDSSSACALTGPGANSTGPQQPIEKFLLPGAAAVQRS